jgi:hypothetical protein
MTTYIVCYSLGMDEKKYKPFLKALELLGSAKVLPNCYLLNTSRNIEEMRVALLPYLEKPDSLFIGVISGEVAVRNALCGNDMLQKILVDAKQPAAAK